MTIEQFQKVYRLSEEKGLDEMDKAVQMVCVFTGNTVRQVEAMSMRKFDKLCARIAKYFELEYTNPPKVLRSGRRLYYVNYNAAETAGRYVEGAEFGKDLIYNMHKILASCVQPMTWYGKIKPYDATKHSRYADDMKRVKFADAYSAGVFFYVLFRELMRTSHPYLVQQAIVKGATEAEAMKSLKDLQSVLDGLAQPKGSQMLSGLN